jgi:hypothetical protein
MGVEPAYPVTVSAVTVRAAYFREGATYVPSTNGVTNRAIAWAAIQTGTRRPET